MLLTALNFSGRPIPRGGLIADDMRETSKNNDEPPITDECLRKHHFALSDLLTFVTALPVGIGVVTAIQFIANSQIDAWIGIAWYSDVRHFLRDKVGVPLHVVTGYVSFATSRLPAWVCYVVIALTLGLIRSRWAFTIGMAFVMSILVSDLMLDYLYGLHARINLRVVSFFGVALAGSSFIVVRRLRGSSHVTDRRPSRLSMGFMCLAMFATFALSIYGWSLVDVGRQEGREIQEIFTNAHP